MVMAVIFIAAVVVYLFKRWMPDGRIKYYFLITIPEAKKRRRMQAEACKRERQLASYGRGAFLGKRLRRFLSTR
jgi:hypothetical protein